MAETEGHLSLPGDTRDSGDYTFYLSREKDQFDFQIYHDLLRSRRYGPNEYSAAFSGRISRNDSGGKSCSFEGRMLACRCCRGTEIAVTFRRMAEKDGDGKGGELVPLVRHKVAKDCDYRPKGSKADKGKKVYFPVSVKSICDVLHPLALQRKGVGENLPRTGLILVTGSTNSAKSELTRGLIYHALVDQMRDGKTRRPHILTYEDPIEKWLFEKAKTSRECESKYGIEYTPREKGVDVDSLRDAVNDALRQTPSVFYVGEVREDSDWRELMRFAGTGHLVIATAHAGSLIEAMERIFRGVNARTAAERGQYAQHILAVIHQIKLDLMGYIGDEEKKKKVKAALSDTLKGKFDVLVPSLWRRTPEGVAALVSDGLSSVLPNTPSGEKPTNAYSIGRRWFAKKLAERQKEIWIKHIFKPREPIHAGEKLREEDDPAMIVKNHFESLSIRYDLLGL